MTSPAAHACHLHQPAFETMPMDTMLQRRLPGVRFDVPPPVLDESLPRMDIAFFVGFAANGPVDLPVVVESLAEFEEVFGGELTLLRHDDGRPVRGLLHASMRQFFSHGGRRAWVQRVAAAHARTSWFGLQQMLLLRRPGPTAPWRAEPAWVLARSPGSWADGMTVRARCEAEPLRVSPAHEQPEHSQLGMLAQGPRVLALAVGDVLRWPLTDGDELQGRIAFLGTTSPTPGDGRLQRLLGLDRIARLRRDTREAVPRLLGWTVPSLRGDGTVEHQVAAEGEWLDTTAAQPPRLALRARLPSRARLQVGEVVRVSFVGGRSPAWMAIDDLQTTALLDTEGTLDVRLTGRPQVVPVSVPAALLTAWSRRDESTTAQVLHVALGATLPGQAEQRRDGLALVSRDDGVASVFDLPDDRRHYTRRRATAARAVQAFELAPRDARPLAGPRFALASMPLELGEHGEAQLLPLATGPGFATGLGARHLPLAALRRDGLDRFDWRLFAEEALAPFAADALADRAEAMRLVGPRPRPLRGLHAVFGCDVDGPVEEPTLLLVPDAVLPGWRRKPRPTQPRELLPAGPAPAPTVPDGFADCALRPLDAPQFLEDAPPDSAGNWLLRWTRPEPDTHFELQEAGDAAFAVASVAYEGADTRRAIVGKPRGHYFFRVRALQGRRISPWSRVLKVEVGGSEYEPLPWNDGPLLALHRLMLRAAAGRGDLLALLGLPEHYGWAEARAHAEALRRLRSDHSASAEPGQPPAIGADETRALSHGALNHGWLFTRRIDELIAAPPDGAIAGQLAATALDRGAWIAVANQPLRDVIALSLPASTAERQAMLEAQVNALWASPRGFVAGGSETLALDADWRAVNVRRLMSLLRRAALQRGATYVFEPHGATLRRSVERAFEALLAELQRRGALAGATAAQAFQVVVDDSPVRADAGQLRIDLKVAPALPLSFLTVRLVRRGDRMAAQELR